MKNKYRFAIAFFSLLAILLTTVLSIYGMGSAVMNPMGLIAREERNLIFIATGLMLIIVIPTLILTFYISWVYRASNKKATYMPYWDHNYLAEALWWGFPCVIVIALSFVTWISSHQLDPFRPLDSEVKPLRIQVVALDWKWLFIYPEQQVATINFMPFPEKTPLNFEITADAPMNSFWIPQLGGQIYAMPGMTTKLHLIADAVGEFRGASANISGTGFSGMVFTAKATDMKGFNDWVASAKKEGQVLSLEEYNQLVKPSSYHPVTTYQLKAEDLFHQIVMKYMTPQAK